MKCPPARIESGTGRSGFENSWLEFEKGEGLSEDMVNVMKEVGN